MRLLALLFIFSVTAQAQTAYVSLANVNVCNPTSKQKELQAQILFEMNRLEHVKIPDVPAGSNFQIALEMILKSYAQYAPVRAQMMKEDIEDILKEAERAPAPLPTLTGPAWVPNDCHVRSIIYQNTATKSFGIDDVLWNNLEPMDQAAVLLQASADGMATLSGGSPLNARRFTRALIVYRDAMSPVSAYDITKTLGREFTTEFVYKNGDVALVFGQGFSKYTEMKPMFTACGYQLKSKPLVNLCRDLKDHKTASMGRDYLYVFGEGGDRILRVSRNNSQSPEYLVEPSQLNLPKNTVDYIFPQWGFDLAYNNTGSRESFQIILNSDHFVRSRYYELTCAANKRIVFDLPDAKPKDYRFNLGGAKVTSCEIKQPVKFFIEGREYSIPALQGRNYYASKGEFTVEGLKDKLSVQIGKVSFALKNQDVIAADPKEGMSISIGESQSQKITLNGGTCEIFPGSIKFEKENVVLSGTFKNKCSLRLSSASVTLRGDVEINMSTGNLIRFSESRRSDKISRIEVLGQSMAVDELLFNREGKVSYIDRNTYEERKKIPYFNVRENKMTFAEENYSTQHFDSTSTFCVNYDLKRLESVSSLCRDNARGYYR